MSSLLNHLVNANKELELQYEDKDGLLKEDVSAIRGQNMFSSFYEVLNSTREYHQKFPNAAVGYHAKVIEEEIKVSFSGEEIFGKYLDLHTFYLRYSNLPNIASRDQDYLQYLDKFNSFFYIPENSKGSKAFNLYISDLWEYLSGFFKRVQPLIDLNEAEWRTEFDSKWSEGKISGWKPRAAATKATDSAPLRLGLFNDSSELEALGGDRLKEVLESMGLKCGGSVKDRAERLWSIRGKKPEDIPQKLRAKQSSTAAKHSTNGVESGENGSSSSSSHDDPRKHTAWVEYKIVSICELMMDILTATRRHTEKQQARTLEEKEAEIAEEEFGLIPEDEEEKVDDDDEEPLYNPLNLPLGWDGKPIPYWLYKLHGLGVEYKCEICGNQSYWGRRAFDKHFQEWRHAHGMRCLGVPNTKHFHDIIRISDVLELYKKIGQKVGGETFVGAVEEEFEDTEGNLLNRRTYEDLARQGLL
jgi:splicing factor 3A subunit 3